LSKEDAEHVILVRGAGELQVGDVVKMHSLQTEAFNGLFGTLTQWLGDKERWAVQLQKTPGKVIIIRADNLMFVRERKAKPLPGNNEITQTLVTMTGLCNRQDWQGILDMEETALLAARALVLPTSRHQGRAEAVYYWLGLANERLAQQLSLRGVDVREHHHTKRALELYQQQLTVTQEHGGRAQQAKAHGNLGNAHILKGGYARASELIQRALDMFQSLGDTASAAVAVQTLTQLQLAQALRQASRRHLDVGSRG
jgi:tetratricopeptide (TPR) repeat protein